MTSFSTALKDFAKERLTIAELKPLAAMFLVILIFYFTPNNLVPSALVFSPPHLVPLTAVDRAIPFSPGWIWVYCSYYLFITFPYFVMNRRRDRIAYTTAISIATIISSVFFIFYPTRVPRELYLVYSNSWSDFLLAQIRVADFKINCAPSLHVALSSIAAFGYELRSRRLGVFAALWACLIAYSTMAVKQHYFIDVATGAALAIIVILGWRRKSSLIDTTDF